MQRLNVKQFYKTQERQRAATLTADVTFLEPRRQQRLQFVKLKRLGIMGSEAGTAGAFILKIHFFFKAL